MANKIPDLVPKKYERRELNWNHLEAIAAKSVSCLEADFAEAILQLKKWIEELEKEIRR
ncbi:hypothetical protein ES705_49617 [subsurface metagenome]